MGEGNSPTGATYFRGSSVAAIEEVFVLPRMQGGEIDGAAADALGRPPIVAQARYKRYAWGRGSRCRLVGRGDGLYCRGMIRDDIPISYVGMDHVVVNNPMYYEGYPIRN